MSPSANVTSTENQADWLSRHAGKVAFGITLLGFLCRLWVAHGTFLNPDEALHFRLANQASLAEAYRASLTASHPPLLTLILYYWRAGGTSELWLRMPLVLAGVALCWMFYKWLANAAGFLAGLIGLLFVALLSPIVALSAEIRQYALLLAFLAAALYFLDAAFVKNSAGKMAAFSLCLYFAMLSHYSAFLFAAALGIYALLRIFRERPSVPVMSTWAGGQMLGVALAVVLYKTHISKLGVGESRTALQGWMSDFFLSHSYFNPTRDNPVAFLIGHSFGVFQFFFGQLAVGDAMGLLFIAGVLSLLIAKGSGDRWSSTRLGVFLLLPFTMAAIASMAHVYPYGGTRHVAFLVIPSIAGVSFAIARCAKQKTLRGLGIAVPVLIGCLAFGKARQPKIERVDQSRAHMSDAIKFVRQSVGPGNVIFTDYESDLILGHYLCDQRPILFETSNPDFEAFTCGRRVISAGYRAGTLFTAGNFVGLWDSLITNYGLRAGETVWVFQAGWSVNLPEELRNNFSELRDLRIESFGNNIRIFKLTVGQSMPETGVLKGDAARRKLASDRVMWDAIGTLKVLRSRADVHPYLLNASMGLDLRNGTTESVRARLRQPDRR